MVGQFVKIARMAGSKFKVLKKGTKDVWTWKTQKPSFKAHLKHKRTKRVLKGRGKQIAPYAGTAVGGAVIWDLMDEK